MNAQPTITPRAAISWSGGKDACLALLRAREQGFAVDTFVTMCEPDGSSKAHALPHALVAAQVDAFGATWMPVRVPSGRYADCFDATLVALRESGHTHMLFGDIDLQAHRDWLEPACTRAGLVALFPLWGEPRARLAHEVIERGIRARLVCVDTRWLDASTCGVDYDAALLARLPPGVCPCGEAGEFHTFVVDAPGMRAPLRVVNARQRAVVSVPPYAATTFVFQELRLDGAAHGR
jgi:diphthine-ammonia ligase